MKRVLGSAPKTDFPVTIDPIHIVLICERLAPRDLVNVSGVSRSWRDVARYNEVWARHKKLLLERCPSLSVLFDTQQETWRVFVHELWGINRSSKINELHPSVVQAMIHVNFGATHRINSIHMGHRHWVVMYNTKRHGPCELKVWFNMVRQGVTSVGDKGVARHITWIQQRFICEMTLFPNGASALSSFSFDDTLIRFHDAIFGSVSLSCFRNPHGVPTLHNYSFGEEEE